MSSANLPVLKYGEAKGDPAQLQAKVKDWMLWYEFTSRAAAPWLAKRAEHRRRWENDPSMVLRLRGPGNGELQSQNNTVSARPALKDWQHVISSPHGFVNEASRTAAMANLVEETNPRWTTRGRQVEDTKSERPLESLIDYQLATINPVTEWFRETLNRGFIQGPAPMKGEYLNESYAINLLPRQWDIDLFRMKMKTALGVLDQVRANGDKSVAAPPGYDPRTQQVGDGEMSLRLFARWTQEMMTKYQVQVPMPPIARNMMVPRHVGIKLSHIELPDLTWDARTPTFRDQKMIMQRLIVSKKELIKDCQRRNEEGRAKGLKYDIFNLRAIEDLPNGVRTEARDYETTEGLQNAILQAIGYYDEPISDPSMVDAVEIIEVWEPKCAADYGWCWVGQRKDALTYPNHYPLLAPVHPFVCHFHIPTPGLSLGKSSYDYNTADHDHLDTMRGLMADYVAIQVGQPLARKGYGLMGETGRNLEIRPFAVIDAPQGVEYGPLYDVNQQLDSVLNYLNYCKGEIDVGNAVDEVARGQATTLNRVGVGEVQLRAQNQQARPRDEMHRAATMCTRDLIPLVVLLCYQDGHPDHVTNVAGGDPFEMMSTDTLWPGLFANHMYMPSALDAASAVAIQQIQETIKIATEAGVLVPGGEAAISAITELWRLQRIPNGDRLAQLAAKDLADAKSKADLPAQMKQLQDQSAAEKKALVAENTGLRLKLNIMSAVEQAAEMETIKAAGELAMANPAQVQGQPGQQPQQGAPPPEGQPAPPAQQPQEAPPA